MRSSFKRLDKPNLIDSQVVVSTLGAVKSIELRFSVLLAALVVSGVGCGSVKDGPGDDAGDFTLTATPTSVNVPIAGTGTVTISVDRTGSGGDVMLSAQNLPAGITATFATNPVPAGTNASNVTFAVAPGTPPGTTNVAIVGSGGGSEKTVTVAVTAQTITVAGTVRGGRAGVMVRLVGKPAVTSGAGGTFTFTDVSPPYDLYTLGGTGLITNPTPSVFYYQGLTRPDPVVSAPATFILTLFTLPSSTMVNGTKTGGDAANPMLIVWDTGGSQAVGPSSYSFTASWPKATTRQGTLYGFQFSKKATGAPDVFTGYASSNQTLTENTAATINLAMTTPTTAALTGTITSPSGFPNPTITLTQQLGNVSTIVLWSAATTAANATIPLVGAGKAALFATATLDNATTQFVHPALAVATDITFALPAPSLQTAPLNAATGVVAATPFTWSAAPNTVYEVTTASTATMGTAKARYQLYTTSASGAIPVVPELALPLNQSFTWNINGYGPNASINDAASTTGLELVSVADFDGNRHWFTNSTDRTFTTAP